jgi:hypothetical protein
LSPAATWNDTPSTSRRAPARSSTSLTEIIEDQLAPELLSRNRAFRTKGAPAVNATQDVTHSATSRAIAWPRVYPTRRSGRDAIIGLADVMQPTHISGHLVPLLS